MKYGLAPYFYEKMLSVLSKPETLFSVSFDESFNKVIQEEQMDLLVRYWDDDVYLVKYGLAPYFYEKMLSVLSKPETLFSVSFDESFNKVIQEEQMDLLVRYWDDEVKEVVTRYFGSEFLGHTSAGDLCDKFLKGLSPLNQANMVQVSMDG